jgi:acyl carrier protein
MQTLPKNTVLPDDPELREKLAEIIARVCKCDPAPLLEDKEFSTVIEQFDSLAVLEILLEIETVYGIETDEMLPVDQETGAQELTSAFPTNITELIAYMHDVIAKRPEREAALQARMQNIKGGGQPVVKATPEASSDAATERENQP